MERKQVVILELIVPSKENITNAEYQKEARYEELVYGCIEKWREAEYYDLPIGCHGTIKRPWHYFEINSD